MEAAAHPWPALGALLLRDGALSVEQLEQALHEKDSSGKRLGEILVHSGFVTPTQVSRVLAEQHELPFIDLIREGIDMGAAGLLPEALARRYGAIPVRFLSDGAVLIAIDDPTNVVAADDLRLALGVNVRVGVARRRRSRTRSAGSTPARRVSTRKSSSRRSRWPPSSICATQLRAHRRSSASTSCLALAGITSLAEVRRITGERMT